MLRNLSDNIKSRKNVHKIIIERRSITVFKNKPVEEAAVLLILDAARWAPSSNNSQPWEFVIVAEKARKTAIADLYVEGYRKRSEKVNEQTKKKIDGILPYLANELKVPPFLIVVCANPEKSKSYLVDTSAAIENMLLMACELGLGTNWIDLTSTDFAEEFDLRKLREYLFIPEKIIPVAIIPLGFPEETPLPPARRRIKDLIHKDFW
jgi:nitroreductase